MKLSLLILALLALAPRSVLGQDLADPTERYYLVGTIEQTRKSSGDNVAVIRDRTNQRTLILKHGDFLGSDRLWRVERVAHRLVMLLHRETKEEAFLAFQPSGNVPLPEFVQDDFELTPDEIVYYSAILEEHRKKKPPR